MRLKAEVRSLGARASGKEERKGRREKKEKKLEPTFSSSYSFIVKSSSTQAEKSVAHLAKNLEI